MDRLSELSPEMFDIIISNIHIKDLIKLNGVCKYFFDSLSAEFNQYVKDIAKNAPIFDIDKYHLYDKYHERRSYLCGGYKYNKAYVDIPITLRYEEYPLAFMKIRWIFQFAILITIDTNNKYVVHEFTQQFGYYGSTPDDCANLDAFILTNKSSFNNINEISVNIPYGVYDTTMYVETNNSEDLKHLSISRKKIIDELHNVILGFPVVLELDIKIANRDYIDSDSEPDSC